MISHCRLHIKILFVILLIFIGSFFIYHKKAEASGSANDGNPCSVSVSNFGSTFESWPCYNTAAAPNEFALYIIGSWTVSGGLQGQGYTTYCILDPLGPGSNCQSDSYFNDGGSGPHTIGPLPCLGTGCTYADLTVNALKTVGLSADQTLWYGCNDPTASNYGGPAPCTSVSSTPLPPTVPINFHVTDGCSGGLTSAPAVITLTSGGSGSATTNASGDAMIQVNPNTTIGWSSAATGYNTVSGSVNSGNSGTTVNVVQTRACGGGGGIGGGGGGSCVSDGSCSAPAPVCGTTTTGTDNCGTSCSRTGGACSAVVGDESSCGGTFAPNSVTAGQTFSATVIMNNTGGTTWDPATQYMLGSQNPQDNTIWGTGRALFSNPVGPGGTVNIAFNITAPSQGSYPFDWKMLQETVRWFGATCTKTITVNPVGATPTPTPTPGPTGYFCSANWVDDAVISGGTSIYGGKVSKTSCLSFCEASNANACNWNTEDSCDAIFGGGLSVISPYLNWSYAWPQSSPCSGPTPTPTPTPTPSVGPTYTIEGWVFNDANNDQGFAGPPSEPGFGGMRISLYDASTGVLVNTYDTIATSPLIGYFAFSSVAPGSYNLLLNPSQIPSGYTITTGSNPFPIIIGSSNVIHNFGLYNPVTTLSTTLIANPNSGSSPLDVVLSANTSGTATGTTNYSFWWNCVNTTTSVATATSACGILPSPASGACSGDSTGFKCSNVVNNAYVSNVTWVDPVNVTPSGSSITKTSGGDAVWNAGAVSSQTISSGDGYVEFSTNEIGTHKMAGLSSGGDTGQGYDEIEYAFYMQGGAGVKSLYVFESGVNASPNQWSYNPGDVLRVAIESGLVKYYQNGTVRYQHAITPVYPYLLDTSLYSQSPNATITNAKIAIPANITPPHTYTSSSTAKVIVERGTAPSAQAQAAITVTGPVPSVSNNTVTVSNSNYCSAGVHATVAWDYSSTGSPPQSNQVAYEVQIDDDSNPLAGNPEWEQSGTTGTSVVTTPCNTANPITSPQTNCKMSWGVLYRAWVRVQNGYGEWSPWTQMVTYCNGSACGPATSWTTPAHQLPIPDFSITPPNPQLGISVIFDDIPPTFDGAATFGSWSWNFGDGARTNGTDATIPLDVSGTNHTYVANGNYTVRLTAEDELGISCSNASSLNIQKVIPRWREISPR